MSDEVEVEQVISIGQDSPGPVVLVILKVVEYFIGGVPAQFLSFGPEVGSHQYIESFLCVF